MSFTAPIPAIAIVLEGGLAQSVLVEDWPVSIPLPAVVVVDHDIEGADGDRLIRFAIGSAPAEALCHRETPVAYETLKETAAEALSPKAVLAALGKADADFKAPSRAA